MSTPVPSSNTLFCTNLSCLNSLISDKLLVINRKSCTVSTRGQSLTPSKYRNGVVSERFAVSIERRRATVVIGYGNWVLQRIIWHVAMRRIAYRSIWLLGTVTRQATRPITVYEQRRRNHSPRRPLPDTVPKV